ncbi:Plastid division protein PDV1 [Striga hermonthica]|uniref:Plastid division protein PDV1 n=1 Tax=Striga hermonthica TaxID=68872 RepID=A0A9N7N9L0_STRHE|nr:Plastid division protein PDV1 [Striga hermonthica]
MGDMEVDEIEAVLEKIWDLHDKLSDAIHSISRAHFLNSVKNRKSGEIYCPRKKKSGDDDLENKVGPGFVFVKEYRADEDEPAVQETKSLYAIRTALENLEDQLEFLHTVQTQQRAEREAAVARLEQSRIILAMRLAEHQGKNYKVIEEALALIGDVRDASRLVSPENLYGSTPCPSRQSFGPQKGKNPNALFNFFISGFTSVSKSLKFDRAVGIMGNAALFAISMLAFMHLNQVGCREKHTLEGFSRESKKVPIDRLECLDVMLARG